MVWISARRIAEAREQACDDLCVGWSAQPGDYREAILSVASRLVTHEPRRISTALGLAMARRAPSALATRLVWIDKTSGATDCRLRTIPRLTIGLIVVGATLALTTVELSRSHGAHAAEGEIFHAYDKPVPVSAKFYTMALTVLDDETEKPIPEAEVKILNFVDLKFRTALTDARGRLTFTYPAHPSHGFRDVKIHRTGYVPQMLSNKAEDLKQTGVVDRTVRLRRGITVGGIVVQAGDKPVQGATVLASVIAYEPGDQRKNATDPEIAYEVPTQTGPDGRWRLDCIPPYAKQIQLALSHPDFVSEASLETQRSTNFERLRQQTDRQVMLKGVRVSGRVVNSDGNPIAGARITDSLQGLLLFSFARRAFTNELGEYHLHYGHNAKEIKLMVQADGYQPEARMIEPIHGMPAVDFELRPGKRLKLRVVDPQTHPIPGVSVTITNFHLYNLGYFNKYTDTDGRLEWTGAPEEKIDYLIFAPGFHTPGFTSLVANDQEHIVTLKPALIIELNPTDMETGQQVKSTMFRLGKIAASGETVWNLPLNSHPEDGAVHLSLDSDEGPYRIEVSSEDYEPFMTRVIRGDEKVFRDTVKLKKAKK